MQYVMTRKIQLGQKSVLLGDLSNLISGAIEVDIYSCLSCGKIELFQSLESKEPGGIKQVKCPRCGRIHDMDYPKCPFCKYDYNQNENTDEAVEEQK